MVLDGVIDPALTAEQINLGQAKGFELATAVLPRRLRQARRAARWGTDVDTAMARLRDLIAVVHGKPAAHQGPSPTTDRGLGLARGGLRDVQQGALVVAARRP